MRTLVVVALSLTVSCATSKSAKRVEAQLPAYVSAAPGANLRLIGHPSIEIASLSSGAPLTVLGWNQKYLEVRLDGAIEATGLLRLEELEVQVCEPFAVAPHTFVGRGDRLRLRGEVKDGQVWTAGKVKLSHRGADPTHKTLRFETGVPLSGLCTKPFARDPATFNPLVGHASAFAPGAELRGVRNDEAIELLSSPSGPVLHTFSANELQRAILLRSEGELDQVAVGLGPYLVGYVKRGVVTSEAPGLGLGIGGLGFGIGGLGSRGGVAVPLPLLTRDLKGRELVSLPAGTVLTQLGERFATLKEKTLARRIEQRGDLTLVTAAVDHELAVTGWAPTASITAEEARSGE